MRDIMDMLEMETNVLMCLSFVKNSYQPAFGR